MDSKSVGRSRTPRPTFRRRGDFSPVSTLAAGDFYERDARSNASQPAVPAFREVSRFARGGSLAADPPENTSTARPQGRDTRHADPSSASEWARSVAPTGEYQNLVTRLDCAS